jgi:hypothetical protein
VYSTGSGSGGVIGPPAASSLLQDARKSRANSIRAKYFFIQAFFKFVKSKGPEVSCD